MNLLEVKNICKTYGSGETAVKALRNVGFSVPKGEYVAIVGESGSGKSTLLNMIGALDVPTTGKVLIDGKDIFSMNDRKLTVFRRRNIGFIFQAFNLIPELTVEQNIIFPLLLDYIRSQSGDGDYITAALHMRQTGPLYNMRSWIENLHNCIDSGNWAEVKYSIKNVKDVVSAVHSPLIKDVQFQLILPPAAGVSFRSGRHGTQLTFLHDLAEFAIKKRPES